MKKRRHHQCAIFHKKPKCKLKPVSNTFFQGHLNTVNWMLIMLWFGSKSPVKGVAEPGHGGSWLSPELKELVLWLEALPGRLSTRHFSSVLQVYYFVILFRSISHQINASFWVEQSGVLLVTAWPAQIATDLPCTPSVSNYSSTKRMQSSESSHLPVWDWVELRA